MNKEEKELYSEKDLKSAENIVRIEIRCMKKKLKELKKVYRLYTIDDFMKNSDIIGKHLYKYYLSKMFGTGRIYTLKTAKEQFSYGDLKPKNAEILKDFLNFANNVRSADKAYEAYCTAHGKKEARKILSKFDYIDTSYVTIPNRDAKLFDGEYIPHPLDLVGSCLDLKYDWRYSDGY